MSPKHFITLDVYYYRIQNFQRKGRTKQQKEAMHDDAAGLHGSGNAREWRPTTQRNNRRMCAAGADVRVPLRRSRSRVGDPLHDKVLSKPNTTNHVVPGTTPTATRARVHTLHRLDWIITLSIIQGRERRGCVPLLFTFLLARQTDWEERSRKDTTIK